MARLQQSGKARCRKSVTLSTHNVGQNSENEIASTSVPPPRPEEIDRELCQARLRAFAEQLQETASAPLPNITASSYRNVYVLLLKWEDEDPNLPVSYEISRLQDVFVNVYHFETEIWDIPDEDCHDKVNQKILDFKRLGSNRKDDLKILYYGGHGKLTRNQSLAWTSWRNAVKSKCPIIKWSGIQSVLEEAESDVLLLLDCCYSGTWNTDEGRGITELMSSCDIHCTANGMGPSSFTHALVTELLSMAKISRFSVSDLYNNISFRIRGRMLEDRREQYPAPVHLILTNDSLSRGGIELSIQANTNRGQRTRPDYVNSLPGSKSPVGDFKPNLTAPCLALAITLTENFTKDELPTGDFTQWLRSMPAVVQGVRIEAGMGSFSPSIINAEPHSLPRENTAEYGAPFQVLSSATSRNYKRFEKSSMKSRKCPETVIENQSISPFQPPDKPSQLPRKPQISTLHSSPTRHPPPSQHIPNFNRPHGNLKLLPPPGLFAPGPAHNQLARPAKYFPDLRPQSHKDQKIGKTQSGEIESLADLGSVLLGSIMVFGGIFTFVFHAIWTLNNLSNRGLTFSYDQTVGIGLIFSLIALAIFGIKDAALRDEGKKTSKDYCRIPEHISMCSFFALSIFNVLAVVIWSPWLFSACSSFLYGEEAA